MKQVMKVCLVEDESILLRSLKRKVCTLFPGIRVIGEAYDGYEALEQIKKEVPDVVITDIRMPGMDGLELTRILAGDYPDVIVMIVSGYDDFQYARAAMQYGVHYYLLKPVKSDELQECLLQLFRVLSEKRRIEEGRKFENLIRGRISRDDKNTLCDKCCGRRYQLWLIAEGNLQINRKADPKEGERLLTDRIEEMLERDNLFDLQFFWIFPGERKNLCLFLAEDLLKEPSEAGKLLLSNLQKEYPDNTYNIAVSSILNVDALEQYSLNLYRVLESCLVIGDQDVYEEKDIPMNLPPAVLSDSKMQKIQTIIHMSDKNEFIKLMRVSLHAWKAEKRPQLWVSRILLEYMNVFQRATEMQEENFHHMSFDVSLILESVTDTEKASDEIVRVFSDYTFQLHRDPQSPENSMDQIEKYIRDHYTETISIADLSDRYHFNPSYLTRKFKKEKGIAPLKLINTLKIQKAEELLKNTEYSVKEISEMLGFSSQHYFSRLFQQYEKLSPVEYRLMSHSNGT